LGKGRPDSLARCKEYFEQAIALDPEFALAHCMYAGYFWSLAAMGYLPAHEAMPLGREEARKALEIDPSLPEAHVMMGIVAGVYDYDWKEAERRFRLALAHDPVPPGGRLMYGLWYLVPMGRLEEALEQQEQELKGDPLNGATRDILAGSLLGAGRLAEAQAELYKVLELDENNTMAFELLARTYARQENWAEALHFAEKASALLIPATIGTLAGVLKRTGEVKRAEELIQKLMPGEAYGAPLGLYIFYLVCGEIERAADWIEKAIEQRHPLAAVYASVYFRSSSRWPALVKLMNLPEEAR
jgi:Tfp pilus assembly protein PilF